MSIKADLEKLLKISKYWTEIRFHKRGSRSMAVRKGELSDLSSKNYEGVGLRVLVDGVFGFASTSNLSFGSLEKALRNAEKMAFELRSRKKQKIDIKPTNRLAKKDFTLEGFRELSQMPLEEKLKLVQDTELKLRSSAKSVDSAVCSYTEVYEDKIIMTSDGANTHMQLVRPELRLVAFASDGSKKTTGSESVGVTGGWECLFINKNIEQYIDVAASQAVNLLKAPEAQGGKQKVILSPSMVGLLCHEAIGHTVEADFVKSGSVAEGKIGQLVASPLVTMCDSGQSEYVKGAGGMLPVDDEGVLTEKTFIIKNGKLVSYLHNRESAAQFGVEPTGNARAWEYSDEPLIRMRNTYIEPGTSKLSEMISGIENGYFVDGPGGGQADATGEFMFGASRVREIKNGKLANNVQQVTLSGIAFDVLKSVDAVSSDFKWDLGSGHCGKGQPAKVDAGGPYVRCEVLIGGSQS